MTTKTNCHINTDPPKMGLIIMKHLIPFLLLICTAYGSDYYETLGLKRGCSGNEIKKAYHSLAKTLHPDKNPAPDAATRFAAVSQAYETLSNEQKRKIYDQHGEEGVKRSESGQQPGRGSVFEHFFGQQAQREERTPNLVVPLRVSLRQLYEGASLGVEFTRKVLCVHYRDCQRVCPKCSGPQRSTVTRQVGPGFVQQVQVEDKECMSAGFCHNGQRCRSCPKGVLEKVSETVAIHVERGMHHDERVIIPEVMDEAPGENVVSGNLEVLLRAIQHEFFERDGDNLKMNMLIPLVDALVGFETNITHVDGHQVLVRKNSVTSCGSEMRVNGEGMPRRGGKDFGDLVITFKVEFPQHIKAADKPRIEDVFRHY